MAKEKTKVSKEEQKTSPASKEEAPKAPKPKVPKIAKPKSDKKLETPKKPAKPKPAAKEAPKKPEAKPAKPKPEAKEAPKPAKLFTFSDAVKKAKELSKPRKFVQTWDFTINLKGMDLKRPENRFNLEFSLPAGRGKNIKVGVFADTIAADAKAKGADVIIKREEIPGLVKNKKKLKAIANQVDWFFGEVTMMAEIGKSLGVVLGPRGKIPKPIPPKVDVGIFIKKARNNIRIAVKESPVIHVPIGAENMNEEDILKNLWGVYNFVKEKLPKGVNSIKSMHIKLTMGGPVRLEVK